MCRLISPFVVGSTRCSLVYTNKTVQGWNSELLRAVPYESRKQKD